MTKTTFVSEVRWRCAALWHLILQAWASALPTSGLWRLTVDSVFTLWNNKQWGSRQARLLHTPIRGLANSTGNCGRMRESGWFIGETKASWCSWRWWQVVTLTIWQSQLGYRHANQTRQEIKSHVANTDDGKNLPFQQNISVRRFHTSTNYKWTTPPLQYNDILNSFVQSTGNACKQSTPNMLCGISETEMLK